METASTKERTKLRLRAKIKNLVKGNKFLLISLLLLSIQGILYIASFFANRYIPGMMAFTLTYAIQENISAASPTYGITLALIHLLAYFPILYGLEWLVLSLLILGGSRGAYKWARGSSSWGVGIAVFAYIVFNWISGQIVFSYQEHLLNSFIFLIATYSLPYTALFLNQSPFAVLNPMGLSAAAMNGLAVFIAYNVMLWLMLYLSRGPSSTLKDVFRRWREQRK